jgi:glycosyltransferase involved in cell wall biosynthesis
LNDFEHQIESGEMKIVYIGRKMDDIVTGGERRISEILRYLTEKNVEIKYLEPATKHYILSRENFILTNFCYMWEFLRIDRSCTQIIVEDYSKRFYLFIFNFFVWMIENVKLVCLVNAFYFSYRKSFIKNLIDRIVSILFLCPMDLIIAGGAAAKKELHHLKVSDSRIKVIEPALRPEFTKCKQYTKVRKDNSMINLLFVGRIHRVKGLEHLIKAVKILNMDNVRLHIVGNMTRVPQYTDELVQLVAKERLYNNVVFWGEIKDVYKLIKLYRNADIFILPSLWDTYPASLLEAMCFGLPIVATNVGGISKLAIDAGALLIPPGNAEKLANAIKEVISGHQMMQKMSERSYKGSLKFRNRTWVDVGKEYYQILSKLWAGKA